MSIQVLESEYAIHRANQEALKCQLQTKKRECLGIERAKELTCHYQRSKRGYLHPSRRIRKLSHANFKSKRVNKSMYQQIETLTCRFRAVMGEFL